MSTRGFSEWTLAKVAEHNARVGQTRPLPPLDTAAARIGAPTIQELRKLPKQKRGPSHLEEKFLRLWTENNGPALEREVVFAKPRRWRFDFAHRASLTAFEIDGGVWNGRHVRGNGFLADAEKLLAAHLLGWRVVRLTAPQLTSDVICQLITLANSASSQD